MQLTIANRLKYKSIHVRMSYPYYPFTLAPPKQSPMPNSDLPPELWMEIVSYLPKNNLRKLIGVNRLLFELALNDLYEEVHFTSNDKRTTNLFDQLLKPNISPRTKHLLIKPAFLPTSDSVKAPRKGKFPSKILSYLGSLMNYEAILHRRDQDIFIKAQKATKCCTSLEAVTLVLRDQLLTPQFWICLNTLWTGPNLRRLIIDTTAIKLPLLTGSLIKYAKGLAKLEELDITITTSRASLRSQDWDSVKQALATTLNVFRNSLTSFKLSSLLDREIDSLVASFPHLPKLSTLEFHCVFNVAVYPEPQKLTKFISLHANTLLRLVIKPYARSATLQKPDISYTGWLSSIAVMDNKSSASFSSLFLPNLRTLDLGLGEYWNEFGTARQYALPDFSRITPNITCLTLTDTKLSTESLITLLDILSRREEGSQLESLEFSCYVMFPELFYLLYAAVPRLKSLSIQHITYVPVMSGRCRCRTDIVFAEKLMSQTYPQWHLRCIRLASPPSSCGATHPNIALMKIVSKALPKHIILDDRVDCQCQL